MWKCVTLECLYLGILLLPSEKWLVVVSKLLISSITHLFVAGQIRIKALCERHIDRAVIIRRNFFLLQCEGFGNSCCRFKTVRLTFHSHRNAIREWNACPVKTKFSVAWWIFPLYVFAVLLIVSIGYYSPQQLIRNWKDFLHKYLRFFSIYTCLWRKSCSAVGKKFFKFKVYFCFAMSILLTVDLMFILLILRELLTRHLKLIRAWNRSDRLQE